MSRARLEFAPDSGPTDRSDDALLPRAAAGSAGEVVDLPAEVGTDVDHAGNATNVGGGQLGLGARLERAGQRTWIGSMYAMPDVQFWAGEMDSTIEMRPGDLLVVAADANQPAVLSATL